MRKFKNRSNIQTAFQRNNNKFTFSFSLRKLLILIPIMGLMLGQSFAQDDFEKNILESTKGQKIELPTFAFDIVKVQDSKTELWGLYYYDSMPFDEGWGDISLDTIVPPVFNEIGEFVFLDSNDIQSPCYFTVRLGNSYGFISSYNNGLVGFKLQPKPIDYFDEVVLKGSNAFVRKGMHWAQYDWIQGTLIDEIKYSSFEEIKAVQLNAKSSWLDALKDKLKLSHLELLDKYTTTAFIVQSKANQKWGVLGLNRNFNLDTLINIEFDSLNRNYQNLDIPVDFVDSISIQSEMLISAHQNEYVGLFSCHQLDGYDTPFIEFYELLPPKYEDYEVYDFDSFPYHRLRLKLDEKWWWYNWSSRMLEE